MALESLANEQTVGYTGRNEGGEPGGEGVASKGPGPACACPVERSQGGIGVSGAARVKAEVLEMRSGRSVKTDPGL